MMVGTVGCGKTTIMNALTRSLGEIDPPQPHRLNIMNPKAITGAEMYGVMNTVTGEWIPGVFSQIWKKSNDRKNKYTSWIVAMDQSMPFGLRILTLYLMTTRSSHLPTLSVFQ
jgi:dynein heavy chain